MREIDLNCDVGEGGGADAEILAHVTSANVACGFHAGGPATMRATVALAAARGVAIGAHPGLADVDGFGRRAARPSPEETYEVVLYQIGALGAFTAAAGVQLQHVKPHGTLYNLAAADARIAAAIARAVRDVDRRLVLFGLAGSRLIEAGVAEGLRTASEVFADRGYRADGTLVPRDAPGALVTDPREVVLRAVRMAREGRVTAVTGATVGVRADTLCVHGDTPGAAVLARALREALVAEGLTLRAVGRNR
jgi:5-oxoprolinase (ATP-hydrolysing) subunit A